VDPWVELARCAVAEAARSGRRLNRVPEGLDAGLPAAPGACFVSLHAANGALRGCIGTLEPQTASLPLEILRNGHAAAREDRRFSPLTVDELADLGVKVDVLGPLEPAEGPKDLDPARFGVVVSTADGRRGVLLPALEGIDRVERQLEIARRKAGIGPLEPVWLQRFTVVRHG